MSHEIWWRWKYYGKHNIVYISTEADSTLSIQLLFLDMYINRTYVTKNAGLARGAKDAERGRKEKTTTLREKYGWNI